MMTETPSQKYLKVAGDLIKAMGALSLEPDQWYNVSFRYRPCSEDNPQHIVRKLRVEKADPEAQSDTPSSPFADTRPELCFLPELDPKPGDHVRFYDGAHEQDFIIDHIRQTRSGTSCYGVRAGDDRVFMLDDAMPNWIKVVDEQQRQVAGLRVDDELMAEARRRGLLMEVGTHHLIPQRSLDRAGSMEIFIKMALQAAAEQVAEECERTGKQPRGMSLLPDPASSTDVTAYHTLHLPLMIAVEDKPE